MNKRLHKVFPLSSVLLGVNVAPVEENILQTFWKIHFNNQQILKLMLRKGGVKTSKDEMR